jgi:hypothetical protein
MRSDEYRRLHEVCLGMAQQSDSPDVQTRWLTIAQASLDRVSDADDVLQSDAIWLSLSQRGAASVSPKSFAIH